MLRKTFILTIVVLFIAIGSFSAGWYAKGRTFSDTRGTSRRVGQYQLTNPLLTCADRPADLGGNQQLASLKAKLNTLIVSRVKSGVAKDVSVYFIDLNNDSSIEINGSCGFEPASLIKLPLMMEYLKRAESDPSVLTRRLVYDGRNDWTKDQNFRPHATLEPGKAYSVEELISRMIVNSDNNAFRTLLTGADRGYLQLIHDNLGVETVADASGARLVTARSYAVFLNSLYNASFLNQAMSEKALRCLSANEFHLGIDATIPDSIPVASKFGERTTGNNGEIKQLHDYGIVYYPNRPYLICIMTRGNDFVSLTGLIREISTLVFRDYDAAYKTGSR